MNKRQRTRVSRELKESITLASLESGCDLVALAKKYKLALSTLSRWRRHYRAQQTGDASSQTETHFVEIKVEQPRRAGTLKKVELSFDNHRCCIEGKLNSTQLLRLVKLLEEAAC